MNIYKYQILKYLENKNLSIKEIKSLPKDEILKIYHNLNFNELKMYLNKRKSRKQKIIVNNSEPIKIIIDWNNHYVII